jgi:hypothetical protein
MIRLSTLHSPDHIGAATLYVCVFEKRVHTFCRNWHIPERHCTISWILCYTTPHITSRRMEFPRPFFASFKTNQCAPQGRSISLVRRHPLSSCSGHQVCVFEKLNGHETAEISSSDVIGQETRNSRSLTKKVSSRKCFVDGCVVLDFDG